MYVPHTSHLGFVQQRAIPLLAMSSSVSPLVAWESYATAFVNLRQLLSTAKDAKDAREIFLKAFQAIEASAQISENMAASIGAIEDKIGNRESEAPSSHSRKPLSESKCVGTLKNLGSDKAEFKAWNDKLINALAQTLGAPWRKFMKNLNRS